MKRSLLSLAISTLALVAIGAGCTSGPAPTNTPHTSDTAAPSSTRTDTTQTSQRLRLTATPEGSRQVSFTWSLDASVDSPKKFLLLRSTEANPEYDGKTYWFRQDGTRRSASWANVPPGVQHFRICTSSDGESCDLYSNDVEINVTSGPSTTTREQ